jgi:hypothetical protein
VNWSALTKKQQQLAIATAVLAVVQVLLLAHFLGWFRPASAEGAGSAKEELRGLQQKLDDARNILRREETIRKELDQSVEKLTALAIFAPTFSDRYAWAYEYVSQCASRAHIDLDSLEEVPPPEEKKDDPSAPYELTVSTRCGYNSLVEFLWRLENGNSLLRVKEVTVASLPDNLQTQQVNILIQWPSNVRIERGTP